MSIASWLFGADKLQAEGDRLDALIRAQNQAAVDRGHWTQAQADAANRSLDQGNNSTGANDVARSIDEGFDEGWAEGRNNVSSAIKNTLNRIVADPFRAIVGGIPWWLWLVLLGVLAWRLGAFAWLNRIVKRKFA